MIEIVCATRAAAGDFPSATLLGRSLARLAYDRRLVPRVACANAAACPRSTTNASTPSPLTTYWSSSTTTSCSTISPSGTACWRGFRPGMSSASPATGAGSPASRPGFSRPTGTTSRPGPPVRRDRARRARHRSGLLVRPGACRLRIAGRRPARRAPFPAAGGGRALRPPVPRSTTTTSISAGRHASGASRSAPGRSASPTQAPAPTTCPPGARPGGSTGPSGTSRWCLARSPGSWCRSLRNIRSSQAPTAHACRGILASLTAGSGARISLELSATKALRTDRASTVPPPRRESRFPGLG